MLLSLWLAGRWWKMRMLGNGERCWPCGTWVYLCFHGLACSVHSHNYCITWLRCRWEITCAWTLKSPMDLDHLACGSSFSFSANFLNWLIRSSLSSIRNPSFSYIGIITSQSYSTAGIPTWQHHHQDSFFVWWTTPCTPVCTVITSSWQSKWDLSGSTLWFSQGFKSVKWL